LDQSKRANAQTGEHDDIVSQACRTLLAVAAIVLAHIASADTDPLMPSGTDAHAPSIVGFHEWNHDEANTTNGQVDVPF
jgi:hypothetical protein